MTFVFFLAFLSSSGSRTINVEKLGLYNPRYLSCNRLGSYLLFLDYINGVIVRVDQNSQIIRYEHPGVGPNELENPSFWQYTNNRFLIQSDSGKLDCFNKDLNPEKCDFPPLPAELSGQYFFGRHLGGDQFLLIGGHGPYRVYKIKKNGYSWEILERKIPAVVESGDDAFEMNKNRALVHSDYLFITMDKIIEIYEVEVRKITENGSISGPIITLNQDVSEFPPLHGRTKANAFSKLVLKIEGGYVVYFVACKETQKYGYNPILSSHFVDFFGEDGSFKGRHELPGHLISVQNSSEILFFTESLGGEEDVITNWSYQHLLSQ